jgi:hypothetical protein
MIKLEISTNTKEVNSAIIRKENIDENQYKFKRLVAKN